MAQAAHACHVGRGNSAQAGRQDRQLSTTLLAGSPLAVTSPIGTLPMG